MTFNWGNVNTEAQNSYLNLFRISQIHYLMVLSANWAYVKDACRMQKYEDIKSKEEQELHDIHSTRSKERLNAYT